MRKVAILGVGQTKISEHWGMSLKELAAEAIFAALEDAGRSSIDGLFIGNMLSGSLNKQENLGVLLPDWAGLTPVEGVKIETACSSGGSAIRTGLIAVASGELDSALVVGVEKMSDAKLLETTSALATAADADYETAHGLSFVALNALIMQRYLHEYNWNHADFAPFSVVAHQNGVRNPNARLQTKITEQEYQDSRMIAKPINLLDASPIGDGAAAVVLVAADEFQNNGNSNLVHILASAAATDTLSIHDRKDPLWLSASEISARRAYSQAGIQPEDIDLFELHDGFLWKHVDLLPGVRDLEWDRMEILLLLGSFRYLLLEVSKHEVTRLVQLVFIRLLNWSSNYAVKLVKIRLIGHILAWPRILVAVVLQQ
jgi:acetyl-CoA C-acetyltransferase